MNAIHVIILCQRLFQCVHERLATITFIDALPSVDDLVTTNLLILEHLLELCDEDC